MLHEVVPDDQTPVPAHGITRSRLRAILDDFTRRGYTSGHPADVAAPGYAGRADGKRRLVLTFDDGTADFLEHALPILEEFHFSATLFVVADFVGKQRSWNTPGGTPLAPVPLMSAADLRDLAARGFTIGSHTLTHPFLPRLAPVEAQAEIGGARDRLADMLGQPVGWFAYPYLAASATTRALVQAAGYDGACGGANQPHERYYLNRIEPSLYSLAQLRLRCNGLFHLARQTYRGLRYRGG